MTNDQMVYTGILECCDTSTNLTLRDAAERKNMNGKVLEDKMPLLMLRGDSVQFVSPNPQAKLHRESMPEIEI